MLTTTTPPYLSGNYAPVREEVTSVDLRVDGTLPEALSGQYVRIGPNPLGSPVSPYHWFMGDGMVHGLTLRDGRALAYRNRWVHTDAISASMGEPPRDGPAQPFYDLSNTALVHFAGELLAITEGAHPYALSRELDTLRRSSVGSGLPHGMTAHPQLDPETGDLHVFSYSWEQPYVLYHVLDARGGLRTSEPIEIPAPISMHGFLTTEHHVVFFDQPAVFDLDALATTGFPYRWKPENGARVGVLPKGGTNADVTWFETRLGYVFHPLNAFELGGDLVLDVPVHPDVYATDRLLAQRGVPLERWTIDLARGRVAHDVIDDTSQEFSRINPRHNGRAYRYGYTVAFGQDLPYERTQLFKHDFVLGERDVHDFGDHSHPGEFVFVADPDRSDAEDGGWLIGLVHHAADARTTFQVLDAEQLADEALATVHLPRRVPFGLHGAWVASDEVVA